ILVDVCRHGVLAEHAGHYCLRLVDAMKPGEHLPQDLLFRSLQGKPLQAVFLNYLLDCLPAAVLELGGEQVKQLCVRTCLARNVDLAEHTDLSAQALADRARSADVRERRDLLEVYGLFAAEYDYRPVDIAALPYGPFAFGFARGRTRRLLHSWGAIQCLERLLGLVHEQGFILASDYGPTQLSAAEEFEHQRF